MAENLRLRCDAYTAAPMNTPSHLAAALFQPFALGDLTLPNRVVIAPLTRGRAGRERIPNPLMAEYYVQRSSAGLIVAEATTISEQANGWLESPGIYTDAMEAGWKGVTSAVHAAGSRIFLQLWHMGRASHSDFHGGSLPVSASENPAPASPSAHQLGNACGHGCGSAVDRAILRACPTTSAAITGRSSPPSECGSGSSGSG